MKCFNQHVSHNYWDHPPSTVVESPGVKVLWDFNIYTDHILTAQYPDIVTIDKHQKAVQDVDIAVPSDCNVTMKESKKIEKYKHLSVELSSLWKMKCEVISIVVGGLGCVPARMEVYLQKLVIRQFCTLELLQQTAVLGSIYSYIV